ncbi:MAG TPA: PEP-CTERM sorting domain-containing protein [Gemmatales bacterium]|nr:PEP-CTERM sorting domain-containing protein [Gemmatales bacterium]
MKRILSLVVWLTAAGLLWGQNTFVAPTALNGVEGTGFYIYNGPITFQQVMDPSQLLGLQVGDVITGMQLRLDSTWLASAASSNTNFDVSIGPSNFAPGSLTSSVAGNQGAGTVLARSGSIDFPLNSFSFGSSPNAFGPFIPFTTNYTYTGGNLLLTISHQAPSAELDFDVGAGITGVQTYQAQVYNSAELSDSSLDSGLAVQFTLATVPEPATYIAVAVSVGFSGLAIRRWQKKKRKIKRKTNVVAA